jgi:cytochrome P450 family 135
MAGIARTDQAGRVRATRRRPLPPSADLPPGPHTPVPVQTFQLFVGRDRAMPRWRRRYGDTFSLRLTPAGTAVVICRPADIRAVFAGQATTFHAGEGNAMLGPVMGKHSVLLLDEDVHLAARRRLMAAFHGEAMAGYADLVERITDSDMDAWPLNIPFRLHDRMNAISLEVILRIVFGVTDPARLGQLRGLLRHIVRIGPLMFAAWAYPRLQSHGPWRRYGERLAETDQLLYAEIAARRGAPDLAERTDVLSRLLVAAPATTDAELRDHLITLLLAGHETTASSLAWAFHELVRRPQLLARTQHAADQHDGAYLSAVIKEAMRLRPVIYEVARRLATPATVGGYRLPAGVVVFPAIGLVHRSESVYPDPDEFRPERFLHEPPPPGAWIPFGGGIRRCLGAGLAMLEAEAVLATVLRRMELRPDRNRPERSRPRNITLVPGRGSTVIATPRGSAAPCGGG